MHFKVYRHTLVAEESLLLTRKFIVLVDDQGFLHFTNFHKFIKNPNRSVTSITEDGNNRYDFVCFFLNYIYFTKNYGSLTEVVIDDVIDFFNRYGKGELNTNDRGRTKQTTEKCIQYVLDFLELLCKSRKYNLRLKMNELYKTVPARDHNGGVFNKKVPVYDVSYSEHKRDIFRDIPNAAFDIMYEHIATHHTELLALVSLSAFAGLRPSEACNVRREDSALGPGLLFQIVNGKVTKIEIDLRKELCLRSDLKPTGRIKKERPQTVPLLFMDAFLAAYNTYMSYIEGKKYEAAYGPLSVNKQGKAITYDSYYVEFRKIVKEELVPIFLKSDDPEVAMYGRLLIENNISPHVFRHWYTVQLVLSGMDQVGELMNARGDGSPESCLVYLRNKSELEKKYKLVTNEVFNYLSWVAKKKKRTEND